MDNPNLNPGYFTGKLIEHLIENHPDLTVQDSESYSVLLADLHSLWLNTRESYEKSGFTLQDSIEQATIDTLNSVSSPYSILVNFVQDHETSIQTILGAPFEVDDLVPDLLPQLQDDILQYQSSANEKDLLSKILRILLSNKPN